VSLALPGAPSANLALSPDGEILAFVGHKGTGGGSQLYIRRLDQLQPTALSGTDEARNPFFAPDGQWIAFFADGKLKKISASGGAAVTLCDAPNGRGGAWAEDGTIVFALATNAVASALATNAGVNLLRVSSAGGKAEPLVTLSKGESLRRWPQMLRGGKAVLFTSTSTSGSFDDANIVVQSLPDGTRTIVQRNGYHGRYLSSGHLVYIHEGTLFAAPFDLDRLEVTGQAVPALEGVNASTATGAAQYAVSANGTLVYLLSGQGAGNEAPIVWMDHDGKTMPLRPTPADWGSLQFSPDGSRLALDISEGGQQPVVWVYEWARDTPTRLTFDAGADVKPVWTPDGRRLVFSSTRGGKTTANLYWQRADGTGDAQRLTESKNNQFAGSWHPSGKFLAFEEEQPQTDNDVMILPVEGDEASGWTPGTPTVFLNGPFKELEPMFSPDGRWLAYFSNESGQFEIYVRPFPGPGGKWQISTGGGAYPMWSRTRHELFYAAPSQQQIMVASYTVEGDSFRVQKPRLWSSVGFLARQRFRPIDLHPDGDRFALSGIQETQAAVKQDKVVFIFNFFDELRRVAPVSKR
jgi:Tol biopolymer transport system component